MEEKEVLENKMPTETVPNPEKGFVWSKRNKILLGAAIIVVILFAVFGILVNRAGKNLYQNNSKQEVNLTSPEAEVTFQPSTVNAVPGKKETVYISIDTWERQITGANIAVKYNPNIISNVSLTQYKDKTSALSYAFEDAVSKDDNGTITLPLVMANTTPAQKGRGIVAALSFTPKNTNIVSTNLAFDKTTTLINRTPGKTIVLQEGNLIINYPVDGKYPIQIEK